jgi:hypothetical protein
MTAHPTLLVFAAGPFTAVTVLGTIAGIAVALPLGACAVAIVRTHVFPIWMAWFAGFVALVSVLGAFAVGATGDALMPGGWLGTAVPALLADLWVLVASGLLVYEHLPVLSARTPPHAVGHA